uniref:Uncharacterized protein n=1 Tax=Phyllostachys edulis TaxID=38705 RepID=D3IVR7_PHYED|nr:putative protein kinase [Phyllostachys edulis]
MNNCFLNDSLIVLIMNFKVQQCVLTCNFDAEIEKADCLALVDFLRGLVEFDPNKRWSPLQASYHPFITGEAFTCPYEPVQETPRIPVGRAAVVDHNPGGGHWLAAGLSPQVVGSINRCLPFNNAFPPKMPFSYGSSCGSFGSHGSFNDNVGLASSYGSYDVNNVNMYHSPLGPSGFNLHSQTGGSFLGSSPDIRRRPHLSHGGGIRLSPGGLGPMSLGASPSQFTPPKSQMQIPTTVTGKYGPTSPARGSHGSSLGKTAAVDQYNRRRNLSHPPISMPPHEYGSQLIQGHHVDGGSASHFDAYARGHSGYPHGALPNSGHFNWRPQIGIGSGLSADQSSSHGSFPPSRYNDFPPLHSNVSADTLASTSSIPDPADWDPNYSDESLLQEDNSLSAELSSLHLRGASQTVRSSRLAHIQSHAIAKSNPFSMNKRSDRLFHATSLGESSHSTGHIAYDSYNHANYSQRNFPSRHGQPFQRRKDWSLFCNKRTAIFLCKKGFLGGSFSPGGFWEDLLVLVLDLEECHPIDGISCLYLQLLVALLTRC